MNVQKCKKGKVIGKRIQKKKKRKGIIHSSKNSIRECTCICICVEESEN